MNDKIYDIADWMMDRLHYSFKSSAEWNGFRDKLVVALDELEDDQFTGDQAPNIYTKKGYEDRAGYLESLAEDYGVDLDKVLMLADLLGPEEDFDGLVTGVDELSDPGA